MHHRPVLLRAISGALMALMLLSGGALAQSATGEITVTVLDPPFACAPTDPMTVQLFTQKAAIEVQQGATTSDNKGDTRFRIDVKDATCSQWTITASLTDFALDGAPTTTIPASTLVLDQDISVGDNPFKWVNQPQWVTDIPTDAATGIPSMFVTPTFTEVGGGGSAASNGPLVQANSAAYGSPGNYTFYYQMTVTGVPADATPGSYTSTATVTVNGADG